MTKDGGRRTEDGNGPGRMTYVHLVDEFGRGWRVCGPVPGTIRAVASRVRRAVTGGVQGKSGPPR